MSEVATIRFKLNTQKIDQMRRNAIAGLVKMGTAINNRAKDNAPVLTSALKNSIRVDIGEEAQGKIYVLAGGTAAGFNVPYARMREFNNRAHPNKTHYMENAFKEITKDYTKYFKGITK